MNMTKKGDIDARSPACLRAKIISSSVVKA